MTEWRVMAEAKLVGGGRGQPVTLRGGFPSRDAAEDHPVLMSAWARVWVEETPRGKERKAAGSVDTRPPDMPWSIERRVKHAYLLDCHGRRIGTFLGPSERQEQIIRIIEERCGGERENTTLGGV